MQKAKSVGFPRYTPHLSATAQQPESELEPVTGDMFQTVDVADGNTPQIPESELKVADVADRGFI